MKTNLADSGINWIHKNLDHFSIYFETTSPSRERLKIFLELIFLSNYLIRTNLLNNNNNFNNILLFIDKELESWNYTDTILRDLDGISGIGVIGEYQKIRGLDNKKTQFIINKIEFLSIEKQLEKIPFRKMDMFYSLHQTEESKYTVKDIGKLYPNTFLGKHCNIFYINNNSTYSITHTLFYLTDMGNQLLNNFETELISIQHTLKILISFYIKQNNLDILSELLMCLNFINKNFNQIDKDTTALLELSYKKISEQQHQSGLVPPPLENFHLLKDSREIFLQAYHTTLVAIGAGLS